MARLLTNAQLGAIQRVAKLGMQTEVIVLRRITTTGLEVTDSPYGSSVDFVDQHTRTKVMGMFHSVPTPMPDVDSGQLVTLNTYRLWVPVQTDIRPGDRAQIGSNTYVVSDTTADESWPAFLACSLRLAE